MKRWIGILLMMFFCSAPGLAQVTPGNVASYQRQSNGVLFQMKTGKLEIEVLTPSVIHVIYSPDDSFPHHPDPMLVRAKWPGASFHIEEAPGGITVSTALTRPVDKMVEYSGSALNVPDNGERARF